MVKSPDVKVIASSANPTVKLLASLRLKKHRDESGLFLCEGLRTVLDALAVVAVPQVLAYVPGAAPAKDLAPVSRAVTAGGGQCFEVSAEIIGKITRKDNPQTVVAAYPIHRRDFASITAKPDEIYVALDRVRDPGNLGAIVRTADAVGAAGVLLIGECCDPYATEAVRATMGSIFTVPIHEGDEAAFTALARRWPGAVVGTSPTATSDYRQARYAAPVLAVLGSEQSGMSPAVAAACKTAVRIPIYGRAESLNLSVATGVLLYAIKQALAARG
ncbi:MAG: RNA methyltransferase [Rhodospirillaceae bacterium]|nr:RNA methyltransferase [Rhodospirillaceae bacterium]